MTTRLRETIDGPEVTTMTPDIETGIPAIAEAILVVPTIGPGTEVEPETAPRLVEPWTEVVTTVVTDARTHGITAATAALRAVRHEEEEGEDAVCHPPPAAGTMCIHLTYTSPISLPSLPHFNIVCAHFYMKIAGS